MSKTLELTIAYTAQINRDRDDRIRRAIKRPCTGFGFHPPTRDADYPHRYITFAVIEDELDLLCDCVRSAVPEQRLFISVLY